ncbi:TonB-dependent receptor domain-containing protein [Aggregatibacter kilianii]|uniref:TonB-dependent receptor domain-containing protein n=1 Tax=Aggregatibacter kilianii TaxID=2025884 RepID=UPI0013A60063|nr:TonB-dependent receptor [Aggregatibacter kilianii]
METKTKISLLICPLALSIHLALYAEEANTETLETITVSGQAEQKAQQGKDEVFLKDQVTEYKSKKEIETYKGHSVGELFNGINGVYSGDTRNSGALDPNIRGVSGQGRIPVIVDGTEQSITVWRGFAGIQNRNYIDPFLVSSISVEKGPALTSDLHNGTGGAVKMKTLEVDDIVKPGEKFGFELKTETANNSIKRRQHPFPMGVDYRTLPNAGEVQLGEWAMFFRDNEGLPPRSHGRNHFFKDYAYRFAAAVKEDKFDFLAAYAYRNKGNYFAGKKGAEKYGRDITWKDIEQTNLAQFDDPYIPIMGAVYKPGNEMPNTSIETKSYLFKTSFQPTPTQKLSLGYRQSEINYGEIMPSRLTKTMATLGTVLEWPLSEVKQKAVNFDYEYNPEDNRWINLKVGVWAVFNDGMTNTSNGSPGDVLFGDTAFDMAWGQWYQKNTNYTIIQGNDYQKWVDYYLLDPNLWYGYQEGTISEVDFMKAVEETRQQKIAELKPEVERLKQQIKPTVPNINGIFNTMPTQAQFSKDNHWGINFSNRLTITPKLNLTVMANYKRETLDSNSLFPLWDQYRYLTGDPDSGYSQISNGVTEYNGRRYGNRNEFNAGFKFDYQATDWLLLSAGARYTHYKSKDNGLSMKAANTNRENITLNQGKRFTMGRLATKAERDFFTSVPEMIEDPNGGGTLNVDEHWAAYHALSLEDQAKYDLMTRTEDNEIRVKDVSIDWRREPGRERFPIEKFPYYDGRISSEMLNRKVISEIDGKEVYYYTLPEVTELGDEVITEEEYQEMLKAERKDHAWAPSFGATFLITPNSRIYVRYDEVKRMPSIYEDTIGYSNVTVRPLYRHKPEHSKNWEVGYVHDLRGFFPELRSADIKLNYFHNVTHNIFDRSSDYTISQFDKRTLSGLELQTRYDSGRIFADLSVVYNIKNKFCDRYSAVMDYGWFTVDPDTRSFKTYPTCVNGGNENGYLKNAIAPKYSITTNFGMRFFDEKLEIGARWQYHSRVKNSRTRSLREAGFYEYGGNEVRWQPVSVFDAYINYKVNSNLSLEIVGTNLTDRYYLDPLARSSMPAPGRTIKLGLTASF